MRYPRIFMNSENIFDKLNFIVNFDINSFRRNLHSRTNGTKIVSQCERIAVSFVSFFFFIVLSSGQCQLNEMQCITLKYVLLLDTCVF